MTTVIPAQSPGLATARQVPRAPLPTTGVTFCCVMSCTTSEGATPPSSLLRAHAPDQDPLTGFGCPYSDESLSAAADHQSLLGIGLSRHYLCNPCVGAWTPTPRCPPGALARFFPGDNGLTPILTSSAHTKYPGKATSTGTHISRLQSVRNVQAPTLASPPGCTHRRNSSLLGGQDVYTTHSPVGYLPRDVVSLRVRHEQLTRLDFHQLDCSLAGCSQNPWIRCP